MDKELVNRFGEILREHRIAAELTQEELAHQCDLDGTYISLLERGIRQPTLTTIFTLCEQIDVLPSVLIRHLES